MSNENYRANLYLDIKLNKHIDKLIGNINSAKNGLAGQKAEIRMLSRISYVYSKRDIVCLAFREFHDHWNNNENDDLATFLKQEMNELKCITFQ